MKKEENPELTAFARFSFLWLWYSWECPRAKDSLFFSCCSKAATLSRLIFDLSRFSTFHSVRHILLLEFWQVSFFFFFLFCRLSVWFFLFCVCNQYLWVFCSNQIGACWQKDWFCPIWFLTRSSSKSSFWLHWLDSHFLGNDNKSVLAHLAVGCLHLPHLSLLLVSGLPFGSIWWDQLFAKLHLVYLITCRVRIGWDYAFSCQKRAFA